MMSPTLSRRLGHAFTLAGPWLTIPDRAKITLAAEKAEVWEKMPVEIRATIEDAETTGRSLVASATIAQRAKDASMPHRAAADQPVESYARVNVTVPTPAVRNTVTVAAPDMAALEQIGPVIAFAIQEQLGPALDRIAAALDTLANSRQPVLVDVQVPDHPVPMVTVQSAEHPAPTVNVRVPPPGPRTVTFIRDANGEIASAEIKEG